MRFVRGPLCIAACAALVAGCGSDSPAPQSPSGGARPSAVQCIGSYTDTGGILTIHVVATGAATLSVTSRNADGSAGPGVAGLAISPTHPVQQTLGTARAPMQTVVATVHATDGTGQCTLTRS